MLPFVFIITPGPPHVMASEFVLGAHVILKVQNLARAASAVALDALNGELPVLHCPYPFRLPHEGGDAVPSLFVLRPGIPGAVRAAVLSVSDIDLASPSASALAHKAELVPETTWTGLGGDGTERKDCKDHKGDEFHCSLMELKINVYYAF